MSNGTGVEQARDGSCDDNNTVVEHLKTKHVDLTVVDDDEIRIEIKYWQDCGEPYCPVKGNSPDRPITVMLRKCPTSPC